MNQQNSYIWPINVNSKIISKIEDIIKQDLGVDVSKIALRDCINKGVRENNWKIPYDQKPKVKISGFTKPIKVPVEICDILGLIKNVELCRAKVTKLLCYYIRDKNLCDSHDRRIIVPDDKLKKLFGLKDNEKFTYCKLQVYLKTLYDKHKNEQETIVFQKFNVTKDNENFDIII